MKLSLRIKNEVDLVKAAMESVMSANANLMSVVEEVFAPGRVVTYQKDRMKKPNKAKIRDYEIINGRVLVRVEAIISHEMRTLSPYDIISVGDGYDGRSKKRKNKES